MTREPPTPQPMTRLALVLVGALVAGGVWSVQRIRTLDGERRVAEGKTAAVEQALADALAENKQLREAYNQLSENASSRMAVDATTNSLEAARAMIAELQKQNEQLKAELARARK